MGPISEEKTGLQQEEARAGEALLVGIWGLFRFEEICGLSPQVSLQASWLSSY